MSSAPPEAAAGQPGGTTATTTAQATESEGLRDMFIATLFFSLMSVLVKAVGDGVPSQQIVLARNVFALIATWWALRRLGLAPLGSRRPLLWLRGRPGHRLVGADVADTAGVAAPARGGADDAGQVFLTRGLHKASAARATSVSYLQVVLAFAWGLLFFGEQPQLSSLLGAGVVLLGTWLASRRASRRAAARPRLSPATT